ncbi:MAG: hypothetical protein QOF51_1338, partial [Chloroflexota bacterium]|nr:hypothetical protein [Chloroflexota bacterium]
HLFQFVEPHKFRLTPFSFAARPGLNMSAGPSSPYGVFIGTTLDEEQLRAGLAACVAESG